MGVQDTHLEPRYEQTAIYKPRDLTSVDSNHRAAQMFPAFFRCSPARERPVGSRTRCTKSRYTRHRGLSHEDQGGNFVPLENVSAWEGTSHLCFCTEQSSNLTLLFKGQGAALAPRGQAAGCLTRWRGQSRRRGLGTLRSPPLNFLNGAEKVT